MSSTRAWLSGPVGPFASSDFRRLWLGEVTSTFGTQFNIVAIAVLALGQGGTALAAVLAAAALPRAALLIPGGWLADRIAPRRLVIASNWGRAAIVVVLVAAVGGGAATLPVLMALAFAVGVLDAIFLPAINAYITEVVDGDQLGSANAWLQGSGQVAALVGPALAGGLVAAFGPAPALAVDAASFAVAATVLATVGRDLPRTPRAGTGLADIFDGIRAAREDRPVGLMIVLATIFFFALSGPLAVAVPWLGTSAFGGSAAIGVLLAAWSAGALAGAAAGAALDRAGRPIRLVLPIALAVGAGLAGVGLPLGLGASAAVLAVTGVGGGAINVFVVTWLQRRVRPELRGRVLGLLVLGTVALSPLSILLTGAVVGALGRATFTLAGALVVLIVVASELRGVAVVLGRPVPEERSTALAGQTAAAT